MTDRKCRQLDECPSSYHCMCDVIEARDAALLQVNALIDERERLRIKCNDLVDKRDAANLQISKLQKIVDGAVKFVKSHGSDIRLGEAYQQLLSLAGNYHLKQTAEKEHDWKWEPCESGGLFICKKCEVAYCSPPWTRDRLPKDCTRRCTCKFVETSKTVHDNDCPFFP